MSSVMLTATCSFFDIKNIEESRLPSKTGAVRFLAVSALVASVFASTLIPAVICTGVIAATTAAIMLKNRQIEQLNETKEQLNETKEQLNETKEQLNETKEQLNETKKQLNENSIVNSFESEINNYSREKKYALLTVCLSYLTGKEIPEMIDITKKSLKTSSLKDTKKYFLEGIIKYKNLSGNELVKEQSGSNMSITPTEDQKKIIGLSAVSILSIVKCLYQQLGKSHKAQDIANFIKQMQPDAKNSIDQTEK